MASSRGPGLIVQWCTRPCFFREINPARSRTRKCLEIAGKERSNGWASTVGDERPRDSRSRIARRVGSASAPNVASRTSE